MNAFGAVLAAGASRRLGAPKQMLRLPRGQTLLEHSMQALADSSVVRAGVVLADPATVMRTPPHVRHVERLVSENPAEGIAASVRAAAKWARFQQADALLICVCDQPAISAAHLDRLLMSFGDHRCPVASRYGGKNGVPAIFPRGYFDDLCTLGGDVGAAGLLRGAARVVGVEWPEGELDVDTHDDWQRYLAAAGALEGESLASVG